MNALELTGSERVLEVGGGTGFLTTMLAMRSGEVVSCEIHEELADLCKANLESHGVSNAKVVHVNAMDADQLAAAVKGPFDVIVLSAALEAVPEHIRAMLADCGQIVAFIGKNPVLSLVHMEHRGSACTRTALFETLLQDMEGIPETREFIF